MNEEKTIWKGSSSQLINARPFGLSAISALLIIAAYMFLLKTQTAPSMAAYILLLLILPIAFALWKYLLNRTRVYELTTQRLKTTVGVFSTRTTELELYRVKDITLVQPFFQRLLGLGRIELATNDVSDHIILLNAIPGMKSLSEQLRASVEACRDQKKVRLAELE
jgi:uncharacterized membrane protein YdbT with pleckstrin-like domain